jgi:hypothetical protein
MWVDIAGLIAPKDEVDKLLDRIASGTETLDSVSAAFHTMHQNYYDYEWTWAYDKYGEELGMPLESITKEQVIDIVKQWKEAVIGLDRELYEDAHKEFNLASMTGFGADGTKEDKEMDFSEVRGAFESNSFVTAVLDHIQKKEALGDEIIGRLS